MIEEISKIVWQDLHNEITYVKRKPSLLFRISWDV